MNSFTEKNVPAKQKVKNLRARFKEDKDLDKVVAAGSPADFRG